MTKHKNKQLLFNPSTREGLVTDIECLKAVPGRVCGTNRLLLPWLPASVLDSCPFRRQCHDMKWFPRRFAGMAKQSHHCLSEPTPALQGMLLLQGTTYRCRKCRRLLATQRNVVPVGAGAGPSAFPFRKRKCAWFQPTEHLASDLRCLGLSAWWHVSLHRFRKRLSNLSSEHHWPHA